MLLNADKVVPHTPTEAFLVFLDLFNMIMSSDLESYPMRCISEIFHISCFHKYYNVYCSIMVKNALGR